MGDIQSELTKGIKTFFVAPDTTIVSEDFLEDFFINGFETYFLNDDPYCKLEWKIESLFSIFDKIILFFNIDSKIAGINWPKFILEIQNRYQERALIGVTYLKQNAEKSRSLERLYLYDIGIVCGCIQLEYQKNANLRILESVLNVNQANGQRKNIRAICGNTCKLDMSYKGKSFQGQVRDVSISHFSCVFMQEMNLQQGDKLTNVLLNLHGIRCNVNAVMCLKRVMDGDTIYVFVFINSDGKDGLEPILKAKVNKFVYSRISTAIIELLTKGFKLIADKKRKVS